MSLGLWLTLLLSVVLETQTLDESTLALAVASCDHVLPEHCSATPLPAEYYVRLHADPALTEVRLEVHRGGPDGPVSASRTLALDGAAPREERARTLGLVVAAQVMAQTPIPPVEPPAPRRIGSRPHHTFTLDAAATAGAALDSGTPRLGGMVRGSWRPRSFGLLASMRGAARPGDDPRLGWLGLSIGALGHREWGRLALEGRAELVGQRLQVQASEPGRAERDSAYRLGGQLGADLFWRVAGPYWLFAGGEAALLGPPVSLVLRGRAYGSEPRVAWGALLGIRRAW